MYTISYPSGTLRLDGVIIDQNDAFQPYRDFVAWLGLGNGPTEIADQEVAPVREHLTATPFKIRMALTQTGWREQVETFVANCDNQNIKDAWEYSTEWNSDHPFILAAIGTLGMSEGQMFSVFELAKIL